MKKGRFKTNYTARPLSKGEVFTKPHLTVPDQAISIKRLLENYVRGKPVDMPHNEGMYFDEEVPVLEDLTDLQEYRQRLLDKINVLDAEISELSQKDKAEDSAKPE